MPLKLVAMWLQEVGDQLICQIQLFAFLTARFECRDRFNNRGVIAWLDNEAARFAASKGTARSTTLIAMARVLQQLEITCPSVIWGERVCSFSNPWNKFSIWGTCCQRMFSVLYQSFQSEATTHDAGAITFDPFSFRTGAITEKAKALQ